jgi:hypothetical protein
MSIIMADRLAGRKTKQTGRLAGWRWRWAVLTGAERDLRALSGAERDLRALSGTCGRWAGLAGAERCWAVLTGAEWDLRALVERCKGGIAELFTGDLVNRTEESHSLWDC